MFRFPPSFCTHAMTPSSFTHTLTGIRRAFGTWACARKNRGPCVAGVARSSSCCRQGGTDSAWNKHVFLLSHPPHHSRTGSVYRKTSISLPSKQKCVAWRAQGSVRESGRADALEFVVRSDFNSLLSLFIIPVPLHNPVAAWWTLLMVHRLSPSGIDLVRNMHALSRVHPLRLVLCRVFVAQE